MSGFKGDYMGFTYNGQHSSNLGIVRTSNGSRFNENLLPTMQDKTTQVPGGDGTYYFGSYYTQKSFNLSFAFDSLTEEKLAEIKRIFGDKKIHELIFDEVPYKVYGAKVTGTATIKHLPFSEGKTNRIYKGEGTIQFTCFYPFARCWSTKKEDYY
jgi:phage-related protein